MKILIVVPEIKQCGPVNVVNDMIMSGIFMHDNIIIVEIRPSEKSQYKSTIGNHIDNIYSLKGNKVSSFFELKKIISKFNPDIVHSHGFFPDIFNSLLSVKCKVSTVHNIAYKDYYNFYGYKGLFFAFIHYVFLLIFINNIVGCSKFVSNHLMRIFLGFKNVYCINNGININKFKNESIIHKHKLREINGFEKFKNIYIYSGGIVRVKRVPELVQFFIEQKCGQSLLLILGDGPEFEKCKKIACSVSNIKFMGRVDNPEYYYQMSDYVISNSSSEGYPLAILEAISCGCYAYLSRIPSHEEIYFNLKGSVKFLDEINDNNFSQIDINELAHTKMSKLYLKVYQKK